MLDSFLEHKIQKKLQLFNILVNYKPITLHALTDFLESTEPTVRSLISELNSDFDGLAVITKDQTSYSITAYDDVNPLTLLHAIYKDSAVLHCLKFLITNDSHSPYWIFIEESFYSSASAYRIQRTCAAYLHEIGLSIVNQKVVGEEYRIRYLIALLYYKYGIDCCGIDASSIQIARTFILATNQSIDSDFLESTSNEYGYFECLLILAWKRKLYPPFSAKPAVLTHLEPTFIHGDILEYIHTYIETPLHICFSDLDYAYIFLIYCSTNNCVLSDKWTQSEIDRIHELVFAENENFSDLRSRIEQQFGVGEGDGSHALNTALVYFYKKFILDLQCIIPDKYFYLDSRKSPYTLAITRQMTELLDSWRSDNNIAYPIDPNHIIYLSLHMEWILRQYIPPIPLVVVADQVVDLKLMTLFLSRAFSAQRIHISTFLLNSRDTSYFDDLHDCIIVLNRKFRNVSVFSEVAKRNTVLPISIEFNTVDLDTIKDATRFYEGKYFSEFIRMRKQ